MTTSIGFIGLGLLGSAIATRLLETGVALHVWNRDAKKMLPLTTKGAVAMDSPRALAEEVDTIIICVSDEAALDDILFGANGVVSAKREHVIVDHSTILPNAAKRIATKLQTYGQTFIDAPITGGPPGAQNGSLIIFAGGDTAAVEKVRPILMHYSKRVNYMDASGSGQTTKLCNQTMSLNTLLLVFETLNLAKHQGLDLAQLLSALEDTMIDSKAWRLFSTMATASNPAKLAHIKDLMKDLNYIQTVANNSDSKLFLTQKTIELVQGLIERGLENEDISEVGQVYE